MKVIFILLLALCLIIANSKRLIAPKPTLICPGRCNCPTIYQPVCGKSGNTHGNACLAKCFKDVVAKVGACEPKCLKDQIKKKSSCKIEPYGRTGTRKYCCKWVEINGLKRNQICDYRGPATFISQKSSCKWKKLSATKRQRVCCNWTRTRVGKRVTNSKKTCKNVGEVVEINRKIGCRRRPFGKIGLRMFCCSHKTVCVGKACRIAQRVCNYRGDVFTERKIKRCKWHKKNAQQRQVRCCSFFQNCRVNPKTHMRKCLKRGKRCAWVGKVITSNTIKRCTLKPFGKNGLRNHCCSFEKRCKGKSCKHTNIRCGWEGCARYQRLKYSCSFVHVKKNTIRKQCCSWKETSICKTKRFSSKKCKWAGKPIITLTRNGCKWKQNGRNSRKLICCQYFRQYYGKKCHKTKKCVVKRIVRSVAHANCHWKKFGKYSKRRRCCSIQKRCEGVFSPIQLKTVRKVIYLNKKGKVTTRKESKRASRKARKAATRKGRKVRRAAPRRKRRSLRKVFKRSLKRHLRRLRFSRKIRRSRGRKVRRNRRRASRKVRRARRGRKVNRRARRNRRRATRKVRRNRRRSIRRARKVRRNRRLRRVRRNRRRSVRRARKVNRRARRNRRRATRKVRRRSIRRARKVRRTRGRKLRRSTRRVRRNRRRASRKVRRTRRGRKVNRRRATRKVRRVRRATRKGRKVRRTRRATRRVRRTRRVVIHRPISWKCKVIKRSCKFAGQVVFKRLTKGCIWKKLNKFSRRRFCCKNKKVCVGKKCKTFKKCSYVGKIVKVSVRKSCSIQSYGNRSSRRKLCCQWKNYCTGIKKFKCRPIQKRCKWVGKIHQRIEKITCKWEKKTRRQKQRYCCRWFRSCVTSKRGVQRNCQDGPKKCSWVGFIIKKSVKRLCNFKQIGKYGRRKYCCNHFRKCKGNKCKINRKGCKFVGPTYSRTPASNCHWKRINRRQKKRRCCYYFNYCVDKKCSSSKKICKFIGKTITTSAFRRCYWKQVVQNGKYGRRRECCRFRKIKGSKGTRIIKKSCVFVGSMVALGSVYFKRDTKCTTTENRKTCCRRIHKCQIKNNKHGCTFYKNEKCVVTIVKVKLPAKPAICVSSGDPHYTTFNGKRFDYYKTGDFLLIESRGFTVHNRLRQWGGVSVNTGFAAKVNKAGETVESESRDGSEVTVNGKEKVKLNNGQKYYFKYGGYVHRIKNLLKVVSQSGDYMDVQCIPFNNGGNKNYQDHYYNIIVRVANKHKYATGFCVNPTPQKVSGLFSQAYNPSNQQPSKKCSVEKRAKVEKKCRAAGITSSRGIQRCIIDCCYNMKPIAERAREILKEEERLKPAPKPVKVVDPKPVKRQEGVCYSLGDPHYRTFAGKNFDNYWVGDFVLVSTKEFTVHARTRPWGRASVNKRIAANLNGDIVEAKSSDKFKLNGNTEVDLQVGQKIRLPKGGVVHRVSQTRVYYYSYKAGYLDADFIGRGKNRYVNLIVKVPHYPESSGACQGNMIAAHGLFQHEVKAQKGKKMKVSKDCHDRARVKCQKRGVQKRYIGSCIIDVCGGLGTKGIRSGVRHVKQDK